jgi:hypothetical protein
MTDGGRQMTGRVLAFAVAWAAIAPVSAQKAPDVGIGLKRDAALSAALAEVSPARIRQTDSALVSFGTRNTMSDTASNRAASARRGGISIASFARTAASAAAACASSTTRR